MVRLIPGLDLSYMISNCPFQPLRALATRRAGYAAYNTGSRSLSPLIINAQIILAILFASALRSQRIDEPVVGSYRRIGGGGSFIPNNARFLCRVAKQTLGESMSGCFRCCGRAPCSRRRYLRRSGRPWAAFNDNPWMQLGFGVV